MGKTRKNQSIESIFIETGEPGDQTLTFRKDRDITGWASYFNRKVTTSRVIVTSGVWSKPEAQAAVLITIIK